MSPCIVEIMRYFEKELDALLEDEFESLMGDKPLPDVEDEFLSACALCGGILTTHPSVGGFHEKCLLDSKWCPVCGERKEYGYYVCDKCEHEDRVNPIPANQHPF